MKIKETLYQKVAVLSLRGKLMGPPASTKLYDDVVNLLENGVIRIVFDLSHVNWINSLGVGAIVKCYTAIEKYKGLLHLVLRDEREHLRSRLVPRGLRAEDAVFGACAALRVQDGAQVDAHSEETDAQG